MRMGNRLAPPPSPYAALLLRPMRAARDCRPQRNLNGGLFRPDPYDDSTVDDIAALDPRLKILQTRSEYRSESSDIMQTSEAELFDMCARRPHEPGTSGQRRRLPSPPTALDARLHPPSHASHRASPCLPGVTTGRSILGLTRWATTRWTIASRRRSSSNSRATATRARCPRAEHPQQVGRLPDLIQIEVPRRASSQLRAAAAGLHADE